MKILMILPYYRETNIKDSLLQIKFHGHLELQWKIKEANSA